ncbi:MAG: DUF4276 family protein [Synergistota bacterium]|nr:DUF4276 family protein [Synergistota bacterium]OPZ38527.1 MAG: hypothetical protein BWY99_01595 [Synergistetes bacterium ADurb.BinA166]HQH80849.1 DUF4276 family protein [bacterium]
MVSRSGERSVRLYVEGGGDSNRLRSRCREGFRAFLERAGFKGRMPRIVACGGRQFAYDRFRTACLAGEEGAMLLLDSEDRVSVSSPWEHLRKEFQMSRGFGDARCHLMVVCMESWFLADREALSRFFGQGFNDGALPKRSDIEEISKDEVYRCLQNASVDCKTKAPYGKGEHSFLILKIVDPRKVAASSPWAARFLKTLDLFL